MIIKFGTEGYYTKIGNNVLQDKTLTYKARGVFAYLLSKPSDWEISMADLDNNSPSEGLFAIRSGLKELEAAGYAVQKVARDEGTMKLMGRRWLVSENKEAVAQVESLDFVPLERVDGRLKLILPRCGLTNVVIPDVGKPERRETTDNKRKKEQIKETNKGKSKGTPPFSEDGWQYKAASWWYDKLLEAGLLTRALSREYRSHTIQKWAAVLDLLHRKENYEPIEIGKVLKWLFDTKDYTKANGEFDKGGFWFHNAKFASLATLRGKKNGGEMMKFDWMYESWKKDKNPANKPRKMIRG